MGIWVYDGLDAIPEPVPDTDTELVSVPAMELAPVPRPASISSDGNRLWRKEAASLWLGTVVKVDSANVNVKVSFWGHVRREPGCRYAILYVNISQSEVTAFVYQSGNWKWQKTRLSQISAGSKDLI